ncbi:hypothetical protein JQK87_00955 [Streptomyces sp. G44]|uniref:hypothetical protein n=1 Tax=Streptomyces sp. G44 TaxID=2807632 RepID=UPI00196105E7|nr:hypothetical protein [Streptomyces sp. G44]MBM7167015.1 hypothetical protein [Streptomyces sp. G44]
MRASAVLTAVGLATAGLLAATPVTATATAATSAAAAPAAPSQHSKGPALMLISQETAKCIGLPKTTAVDRGVRGLALVRLGHTPVKAPQHVVAECFDEAAEDAGNPIHELARKHGDLLGLKADSGNTERPPKEWRRSTPESADATPDAHRPTPAGDPVPPDPWDSEPVLGTEENPAVAIVDTVVSKVCTDVPVGKTRGIVELAGTEAQDLLTAPRNQRCGDDFSPYGDYEPLLDLIEKLPRLSDDEDRPNNNGRRPART